MNHFDPSAPPRHEERRSKAPITMQEAFGVVLHNVWVMGINELRKVIKHSNYDVNELHLRSLVQGNTWFAIVPSGSKKEPGIIRVAADAGLVTREAWDEKAVFGTNARKAKQYWKLTKSIYKGSRRFLISPCRQAVSSRAKGSSMNLKGAFLIIAFPRKQEPLLAKQKAWYQE